MQWSFLTRGYVNGNRDTSKAFRLSGADTRFSLYAGHLRSLVVQHPTKWSTKTDQSINRWEALWKYPFGQPKQEVESEVVPHIRNLQWWDDAGLEGIDPKKLWFFHPVRFLEHVGKTSTERHFPLSLLVLEEFRRNFGEGRSGGRKHAGCDLIGPVGAQVRAVADGEIRDYYAFYWQTYAIVVDHGDFLVRYGEVQPPATGHPYGEQAPPESLRKGLAPGVCLGGRVDAGQTIGYVGQMRKFESGVYINHHETMLHFEMYSKEAAGSDRKLTVRSNPPFQRRSDLVDPTPFLETLRQNGQEHRLYAYRPSSFDVVVVL